MFHRPAGDATRAALWLVVIGYLLFVAWRYYDGYAAAARGETPLYTDYTSLYAASLLLRNAPADNLYIPQDMYQAELETARAIYGDGLSAAQAGAVGFAPWMYPPVFILFAFPLAFMPYLLSLSLWTAATLVPYLAAMRRILPAPLALPFALAAPPAFFNLMYGQTGFLSAGLIALGLAELRRRPTFAGVCIGLACFKPHLGILLPLALVAGGLWQPFGVAVITVVGMVAASILLFGIDPWFGFIGTFMFHLEGFGAGAYAWNAMATVLSTLRLAGADLATAWKAQYLAAGLVAGVVAWAWHDGRDRPERDGLLAALVCIGTPLVVPMAYLYDLVLAVPGAAWVWADLRARGGRRWEWGLLGGAMAALLAVKPVAEATSLQVGTLCVAALFGLALYRYRRLAAAGRDG